MRPIALPVLRESIAACSECFAAPDPCRHYEDALGGYGKRRIVLVGINPQGRGDDPVYREVEALPWQERNLLGDRILDLFVAERAIHAVTNARTAAWRDELRRQVVKLYPGSLELQGIPFERHKGLRTWFPCVADRLGCSPDALRDHVTMIDAIKHATDNESALGALRAQHRGVNLRDWCGRWLEQKLVHLEPRGVIFTGNNGVKLARELLALEREDRRTIGKLHGEVVK